MSRPSLGLGAALLVLGGGLVAWNVSRFMDAQMVIRMDPRLEFLPDPEIARALTLGHHNTAAKLRWIDSFAHLSYQMDHSATSGSTDGLRRLYRTLIELDPHFEPYYEHAATALGGLKGDLHGELVFSALGIHHNPSSTRLWAAFVTALSVHYGLEEREPELMEDILERWGEAESAKEIGAEHLPSDWLAALARRHQRGLEQMAYWGRLLLVAEPKSPQLTVARRVMREQLAAYAIVQLEALVTAHRERTGADPTDLAAVLHEADLQAVYDTPAAAVQPSEPIAAGDQGYVLRSDPYGEAYRLDGGAVISPGLERTRFERRVGMINQRLRSQAIERGSWPNNLAQAAERLGGRLPEVPEGSHLALADGLLVVRSDLGDTPWGDAELLAAAGLNPEGARD